MTARQATLLEELQPAAQVALPARARPVHVCETCGESASFGFTTRRGMSWFCTAHRADGEKVLVAPDLRRHLRAGC